MQQAFEWGTDIVEYPLVAQIKKITIAPRDRYVEDWELREFKSICNSMLKAYIPLKVTTGKE
jgi:hypothetical protein